MDNWQHRSRNMTCAACMWFIEKTPAAIKGPQTETKDVPRTLGRCRRHSPTLGGWPAVFDGDWCGDHKLDENRL